MSVVEVIVVVVVAWKINEVYVIHSDLYTFCIRIRKTRKDN